MVKRQIVVTLSMIILFLFAGCSSSTPGPTPEMPSIETLRTSTHTKTALVMTPTWTPTPTPTPVVPPKDILVYQPLNIGPGLPVGAKINDALLINGNPPFIIQFEEERRTEAVDIGKGSLLQVSPDGKWFAYVLLSADSPTGEWLIAESADQHYKYKVSLPLLLYSDAHTWVDNHRLIFPLLTNPNLPAPMLVIDPSSGEKITLPTDYPDFSRSMAGPLGRMSFNYSDVVYDPSLNFVVYSELDLPKSFVVLWDRSSHSKLAKLEEKGIFSHYPLWSPDGQSVAVAVTTVDEDSSVIDEWFDIDTAGQIQRLTHFGDYFVNARIYEGNWSPDGKWLAFWLETTPTQCGGERLAILEIATQQVADTCIAATTDFGLPPVWSLDSRYIALNNFDVHQTIIIDVEQRWAAQLPEAKGARPNGWLTLGP